jgi:cytochrome c peroxidase
LLTPFRLPLCSAVVAIRRALRKAIKLFPAVATLNRRRTASRIARPAPAAAEDAECRIMAGGRSAMPRIPILAFLGETGTARVICVLKALAIGSLVLGGLEFLPFPLHSLEANSSAAGDEPITPVQASGKIDPLKAELGGRLFRDVRLSRDNTRSCSSCHDLRTNGASHNRRDVGLNGSDLPFNTPTVFNAALSFRFNWEGTFRTLEAQAAATVENPQLMGSSMPDVVKKLEADVEMRQHFVVAYGRDPEAADVLDAIASFERSLITTGSQFDRWLAGDSTALSSKELSGYGLFKSLGCVSCHQGVNIGGNLFQRQGIFHPLAGSKPEILRVPSLRNVATTAPYFHDGSAPTLADAVRRMSFAQLNSTLSDKEIEDIVAYLGTLTGTCRGASNGGS